MGTGPEVTSGADVVLAEIDGGFAARADTPAGARLLAGLELAPASPEQVVGTIAQVAATRAAMGHAVAAEGLHDRLLANLDHPRWDAIAERCLACANCTLVCPTCFCTGVTDRLRPRRSGVVCGADLGQLLHRRASPRSPAAARSGRATATATGSG